jgi:guanosine-3',5'-bis(diphosphate) 3'-pyrophosphohydrolase
MSESALPLLFSAADVGAILRAVVFAADRHQFQRRKDADATPYINHPLRVAELLYDVGQVRDGDLLVAALLHDTIEDTATLPAEIAAHFGERVLGIVLEVTDDKSLPKQVRKTRQIEHAPHLSAAARTLKLADKSCNVTDLAQSPPADWSRERISAYLDWAENVVAGLRGVNAPLEAHFDGVVARARTLAAGLA